MSIVDQMKTITGDWDDDPVVLVVMTPVDFESLKSEVRDTIGIVNDPRGLGLGNKFQGVEVLASDKWVGPPRGLTRSEADTFRGRLRTADFRTTPVKMER